MRVLSVAAAVVVAVVCLSSVARGEDLAAAREHYQSGNRAYEVGEYDEAAREFTAAYKAHADPAILFNLAQSQRLAGHPVEAERAYRMYLVKVPDSSSRAEVERIIGELRKQKPGTATLDDPDIELVRRHFRAGAELYAQEKYVEAVAEFEQARGIKALPTLEFNIARCYDRLERLDDALASYQRYVATRPTPGDADEVRARMAVLEQRRAKKTGTVETAPVEKTVDSSTTLPASPVEKSAAPSSAGRGKRIGGIVVGVIGLGALGAGIGLGVEALSENNRLSHPKSDTHYSSAGLVYQNAGIALMAGGGAAIVTGIVLYALGHRERRSPSRQAIASSERF